MVAIVFQAGGNRYGLDIARVVEVVPMVAMTPVPHAPAYVAGLCNYRGLPVPVIDLPALLFGRASRPLISTRIMLVRYRPREDQPEILGLLAEGVTETRSVPESAIRSPGIAPPEAGYLGGVATEDGGLTQFVDVDRMLPDSLRRILFTQGRKP